MAGPKLEWSIRRDWLAVTAALNAQYAFALVQSLAYMEAEAYLPEEFVKSPLRKEGYYYAQGAVSSAVVSLAMSRYDLVAAARGGWYWSINARDRARMSPQGLHAHRHPHPAARRGGRAPAG